MANFFKSKKGKIKPVATIPEKPRFFKQLRDFKAEETIAELSGNVFHDRRFWIFATIWFLPILASAIFAAFNFKYLPNQIPLFYSKAWGESQLAQSKNIFLPILGATILGIFNFIFSAFFHPKDKVFSYLLMGVSALISVLAAITTFNIINLMK